MQRAVISLMVSAIALGSLVLGACSSKDEPPPTPPAQVVVRDADVDGIMEIGGYDPTSGMHLDDDGAGGTPSNPPRRPQRTGTPIGIMLKSTPPGAVAAVDGVQQGKTPAYWSGEADGREHEFTFVLRGHAVARYRFVPIASGVVHATLEPVAVDHLDGGLAPVLSPSLPDAAIAPPQTILTPVDATQRALPDPAPLPPAQGATPGATPGTTRDAAPAPAPDPTGAGPQP